ncbi:hypothetical protein M011DRAFT_487313 [Sporormia fimetaria CBS 119925]|uniref:Uncharacterized protein n=1 Tax=Sporormia fimetaria CBS 119925 TaxID=1340428 RepID=A0A6A6V7R3_9PLEO|nr:hypothetical protein M011DRAFT_487313 [Sporormia fimetaria CBS 119925]
MEPHAPSSQSSEPALLPSTEISRPETPKRPNVSASPSPEPSLDQPKNSFAAPPPASMTPPPSSQVPPARSSSSIARTPTPPTPQLTSPPPTMKPFSQPSTPADAAAVLYSPEQVDNASADELRAMVADLTAALRDTRLSAAHHKLQYNMAVHQGQETANRLEVELFIAQSEVDVLRQAEEQRRAAASPVATFHEPPIDSATTLLLGELRRVNQSLQDENEELRYMLDQSKRVIAHRDGELATLREQNAQLRTRIKDNRLHTNALLEQASEHPSPRSVLNTPRQPESARALARQRSQRLAPAGTQPGTAEDRRSNFEALLLADQMLQGNSSTAATAPSTPRRATQSSRSRPAHTHRPTHSLSSLPQTPRQSRPQPPQTHTLPPPPPLTPPGFTAVNHVPSSAPAFYQHHSNPTFARRRSGDSTVTASSIDDRERERDVDDEEAYTDREEDNDSEIPESQASQVAASMLRRVGGSTNKPSPSAGPAKYAPQTSNQNLVQSKIYGHVKKGVGLSRQAPIEGAEKRRLPSSASYNQVQSSPQKKVRRDREREVVGLGIVAQETTTQTYKARGTTSDTNTPLTNKFNTFESILLHKQNPPQTTHLPQTTHPHLHIMSAQNTGRQSPPPESQSGAQQQDTPAGNVNKQGGAPSQDYAKEASDDQKSKLSSNPEHPLAKHSEETTSKTQ